MHVLFIAWGVVALLIIGVRIGHHFGYSDAQKEMQSPRLRELREVARWLDPAIARRRQLIAAGIWLFIIAGFVLWLH